MLIRCIIQHRTSLLLPSADQYSLDSGISGLLNCFFVPDVVLTHCFLSNNTFCVIRKDYLLRLLLVVVAAARQSRLLFHRIEIEVENVSCLFAPMSLGKEAKQWMVTCSNYGIKTPTIKTKFHIHRQQWQKSASADQWHTEQTFNTRTSLFFLQANYKIWAEYAVSCRVICPYDV